MTSPPFASIELPATRLRPKPRQRGLTMMADWGLPLTYQKDLLRMAGRYVDFAKIVTGTARLYDADYLAEKLQAYRDAQVRPFIGGQFVEYVFATEGDQALRPFFEEARRVGFDTIEISDNCVPLTDEERRHQILLARDCGLAVMGEVGSKDSHSEPMELVRQARVCLEAGCELVLVEAAELAKGGRIERATLDVLVSELDLTRVMIELPGPWITGVTLSQVDDLKKLLITELGPEINLANLKPDDLIATEALRVGLGVVGPKPPAG